MMDVSANDLANVDMTSTTGEPMDDPVIQEIEKFMFEYENGTRPTVSVNNNVLDNESLLNILEDNIDTCSYTYSNELETVHRCLPLKKRKIHENPNATKSKKSKKSGEKSSKSDTENATKSKKNSEKSSKSPTENVIKSKKSKKNREKSSKGALENDTKSMKSKKYGEKLSKSATEDAAKLKKSKKKSSKKWTECSVKEAKICRFKTSVCVPSEFSYPRKKRARILEANKVATVSKTVSRNDSYVVQIDDDHMKCKVVDVTNDDVMCVELHFGKNNQTKEISWEECEMIPKTEKKVAIGIEYLQTATIYTPEVHCELTKSVIDLTECDDEESSVIVSEKECANIILNILHKFYNLYKIQRREEVEVSEILDTEDCTLNLRFKQGKILGVDLIHSLKLKRMKNLDMARFLNIILYKLEQTFNIFVSPTVVALYLYLMLYQNKTICTNQLLQDLLKEATKILQMVKVKLEKENEDEDVRMESCSGVFTEEQLSQLYFQVEKYNEICIIQEVLMDSHYQQYQNIFFLKKYEQKTHDFFDFLRLEYECEKVTSNNHLENSPPELYLIKSESQVL